MKYNPTTNRRGAVSVEMAFVVTVITVVFFGLWEWSRVEMIRHVCEYAVFEGARHGTLPGSTESNTQTKVHDIFDMYLINGATVNATFDPGTGSSTVNATVPIDSNVGFGYAFFAGKSFTAELTLDQ